MQRMLDAEMFSEFEGEIFKNYENYVTFFFSNAIFLAARLTIQIHNIRLRRHMFACARAHTYVRFTHIYCNTKYKRRGNNGGEHGSEIQKRRE